MYGTIPIAASFSEKGMEADWLAAFMMSSILLNLQLVIRILSCFVCGAVAGLCIRLFYPGKPFFNFSGFKEPARPYFPFGIVRSALFQRYVPEDIMVRLFGNNRGFGVLMVATIGVPLYACGGTIPLLQGWLQQDMSMAPPSLL